MQFREQAKKIQFIRSIYNPVTKRCDQKMVGSMSRYTGEIPSADQLAMLTDMERLDLSNYLAAKKAKSEKTMHWSAVYHAHERLSVITDAILADEPVKDEQAAAIWAGIAALSKALKKAGHPKPARTAKEVAEDDKDSKQMDLMPPAPVVHAL